MPISPEIRIPTSSLSDIRQILAVPSRSLDKLVTYLGSAQLQSDIEILAEDSRASVGLEPEIVQAILTVAINISQLRRRLDVDARAALDILANTLSQNAAWTDQDGEAFSERIPMLMALTAPDSVSDFMSKARELLYEAQCVLLDSALITDSRWIYSAAGTEVRGCVVIHTLSLDYAEGSDRRQLHLTLSEDDVLALQQQLQRASTKSETARNLLQRIEVPELTPKTQPRA